MGEVFYQERKKKLSVSYFPGIVQRALTVEAIIGGRLKRTLELDNVFF